MSEIPATSANEEAVRKERVEDLQTPEVRPLGMQVKGPLGKVRSSKERAATSDQCLRPSERSNCLRRKKVDLRGNQRCRSRRLKKSLRRSVVSEEILEQLVEKIVGKVG